MKIKNAFLKVIFTGLVLSNSLSAIASEESFKVAIIGGTYGNEAILEGDLNTGIRKLKRNSARKKSFETSMGLCTAYIKTKDINSESACSSAIDSANAMNWKSKKGIYLKSLGYSNRGIARYMNNNISGAIDDLTIAVSIDENPITKNNLALVKNEFLNEEVSSSVAFAD